MSLPYNNNTPQASQVVAQTQAPILANFQSIDTAFNGPTGSASGGGNFTTYSLQNTTASYAAKPVNPIGSLHTIASSAGNPELAWINNVNSTGAGPYNGTQLTGGGVTAGAWVFFTVNTITGAITVNASYNVTSVTNTGAKTNKVITFARNFTSTSYVCIINPYQSGTGDNVNRKTNIVTQAAASLTFNVTTVSTTAQDEVPFYHCLFFGILV